MTTPTRSDDLQRSLEFLLAEEGGWSDHPNDKGGQTFNGVTQATYDDWRSRVKKQPKQSVRKATPEEIRELYEILYWRAAGCDRFPWPINYVTFDASVNSGVSRGVRWTQAGLGAEQDGKVGPNTLAAAKRVVEEGDSASLLAIVTARADFVADLVKRTPSQAVFLKGWTRRLLRVLGRALVAQDD